MNAHDYQERVRNLQLDLKDVDRLNNRISRLFPNTKFEVKIKDSKLSISGLTKDQMDMVMTP